MKTKDPNPLHKEVARDAHTGEKMAGAQTGMLTEVPSAKPGHTPSEKPCSKHPALSFLPVILWEGSPHSYRKGKPSESAWPRWDCVELHPQHPTCGEGHAERV